MSVKKQILFALLNCFITAATAQKLSAPGDMFVVYGEDARPLFPIFTVSDEVDVVVPDNIRIDLTNTPKDQAPAKIVNALKKIYLVEKVIFYPPEKIASITVLGEVENPGNFLQPQGSSVEWLNSFNHLYDNRWYSPAITLIRQGERKILSGELIKTTHVEPSDIFMLALKRRKQAVELPNIRVPEKVVKPVIAKEAKQPAESVDSVPQDKGIADAEVKATTQAKPDPQALLSKQVRAGRNMGNESSAIHVNKDYMLQAGDILTINLPGEDGFNKDFLISRSGDITVPEVGQVNVAQMTLSEAEKLIHKTLSNVFLGLDKLVVLVKERRLLVTVLGFVKEPGEVEMTSNGNVQTAINEAGGLLDGAQLNKLQLQRGDKVIEFDFKEYLDSGNSNLIPELLSLDTIFVPSSPELGNVHGDVDGEIAGTGMDPTTSRSAIKVFGEVKRPGSFQYVENMSVVDALLRAGGVTRYANVEQISVIAEGEPVLFDLKKYLDSGSEGKLPILPEGATVFIPTQVEAVKSGGRVVYVMGQVQKPGAFETGEEVGFLDVLANAGGPNRYADNSMLRILRSDGTVVRFDLQAYAEGNNSQLPKIMGGDAIFIPQKSTLVDDSWLRVPTSSSVQMMGAVKKPGRYQWAKGINFMDMLAHAGGPTEKADIAHVRIVSTGSHGEAISHEFNMQNFLERGGNWNSLPSLKGGVTVIFPELPEDPSGNKSQWIRLASEQSIYIMGAVITPGRYAFNDQMDFLDILSAAQGPKDEADLTNIRIIHRNGPSPRVSQLNLVEYFETGDETLLPDVSTGDSIFIPSRNRSWVQKKKDETIRVLGSVQTSGRYEFDSEMTILDVLAESGGPTKTAYIEKIIIVNSSCCKNQAYTFDLMDFMKDPDVSRLPVLRPGDTVYVPDVSNTQWAYFMEKLKDTLSVVSFVSLTKALIGGSAL